MDTTMKTIRRLAAPSILLLFVTWSHFACAEGPTVEAVAVVITTSGVDLDADGYRVSVGQDTLSAGVHDSVVFTDLGAGEHTVAISEIATNCDVDPPTPQSATVVRGSTAVLRFTIVCRELGVLLFDAVLADGTHPVYIVREDGIVLHEVVPPQPLVEPRWSPDAARILLYQSNGPFWIMNADGSDVRTLTPLEDDHLGGRAWSPDATRIAYVLLGFEHSLLLMDPDGSGHQRLWGSDPASVMTFGDPAWSPDGTFLAFAAAGPAGDLDIYVVDVGTGTAERITNESPEDQYPSWSPDGGSIAFLRGDQVYLMNPDGSAVTPLTPDHSHQTDAAWSPDGSHVAFSEARGDSYNIFVADVDAGTVAAITEDPERDFCPQWSPDGLRIVFRRWDPAAAVVQRRLYVVNPRHGGMVEITEGIDPLNLGCATWRP